MGWLIAIILAVLVFSLHKEVKTLRAQVAAAEIKEPHPEDAFKLQQQAVHADRDLIVLRLQFESMCENGTLPASDFRELASAIDSYWGSDYHGVQPRRGSEVWWESCEAGWNLLKSRNLVPFKAPPWRRPGEEAAVELAPASKTAESEVMPALPAAAAPPEPVAEQAESSIPEPAPPPAKSKPAVEEPEAASFNAATAWPATWLKSAPAEPGPLERVLQVMSGWPKVLVPFLIQNIGWFIGGFLFLAGTIFLVTYTTGFIKAAIVFVSLFAYTMFLIWAGYKLLQRRPRLTTAGSVLLSTGLLLVPLTIASATRLMMNAGTAVLLWIVGLLAAALCVGTFYFAAQLVSGTVHRSLRGEYSKLFLAVAALQLTAPVIFIWPQWVLLGGLHLLLLGLVTYGLTRFTQEWLQSIFVDRRKVAAFAAGSLLYAALISFVHLTWGVQAVLLPAGYYAPYIMAVCALLFYLDAQLKIHAHRNTFLSRFSFLIYGLSIIAFVMSLNAPAARLVTLALAAVLYAMVLWKYLTLIPLYLMLASLAGLYAWGFLQYFPAREMHFVLALPGVYGLIRLSHWATARGESKPVVTEVHGTKRVGLITYRITILLLPVLAIWSLVHSMPGPLAMSTALLLAVGMWWLLRLAPGSILVGMGDEQAARNLEPIDLLQGPWLYAVIAAVTLGFAFAPHAADVPWASQFCLSLMLLGSVWVMLLIYLRRAGSSASMAQTEVYANSALISVFTGTILVVVLTSAQLISTGIVIGILGVAVAVLLALSLHLYVRWLFYAFLLWIAGAGALVKLTYFPQRSLGLVEFSLGLGLWALLWWLDREPDELSEITRRRAWRNVPQRLLWLMPCASPARPRDSVDNSIDLPATTDAITGDRDITVTPKDKQSHV